METPAFCLSGSSLPNCFDRRLTGYFRNIQSSFHNFAHLAGSVYEKNLIRLTNQKLLQSIGKFPE